MREIKFRAWDGEEFSYFEAGFPNFNDQHPYQQFTGLKDKNGAEIYEGDILKELRNNYDIYGQYVVEWSDELTGFMPFNEYDSDCGWYYPTEYCEVIGNIMENPELLESK